MILFAPEPGGGLTFAESSLETPRGRVACRWQIRSHKLQGEVLVPPEITAELRLPGQHPKRIAAGRHHFFIKIGKS